MPKSFHIPSAIWNRVRLVPLIYVGKEEGNLYYEEG